MQTHGVETRWDTIEIPRALTGAVRRRQGAREDAPSVGDAVEGVIHLVMGWTVATGVVLVGLSAVAGG